MNSPHSLLLSSYRRSQKTSHLTPQCSPDLQSGLHQTMHCKILPLFCCFKSFKNLQLLCNKWYKQVSTKAGPCEHQLQWGDLHEDKTMAQRTATELTVTELPGKFKQYSGNFMHSHFPFKFFKNYFFFVRIRKVKIPTLGSTGSRNSISNS